MSLYLRKFVGYGVQEGGRIIGIVDFLTPDGNFVFLKDSQGHIKRVRLSSSITLIQGVRAVIEDEDEDEDEEDTPFSKVPDYRKGMDFNPEGVAALIRHHSRLTQKGIAEKGGWNYARNVSSRMTDANMLARIKRIYGEVILSGVCPHTGHKAYTWIGNY